MELTSNVPAWKSENMLMQEAALFTVSDFTARDRYISFNPTCIKAQSKETKLCPYKAAM